MPFSFSKLHSHGYLYFNITAFALSSICWLAALKLIFHEPQNLTGGKPREDMQHVTKENSIFLLVIVRLRWVGWGYGTSTTLTCRSRGYSYPTIHRPFWACSWLGYRLMDWIHLLCGLPSHTNRGSWHGCCWRPWCEEGRCSYLSRSINKCSQRLAESQHARGAHKLYRKHIKGHDLMSSHWDHLDFFRGWSGLE